MIFTPTSIRDAYLIKLTPFYDSRGWFARSFCKNEFKQIDHNKEWLQLNHSFTSSKGTIRGMHFQLPPYSEIKLVRCIAGAVYDVIVDLRKNSSTFLKWAAFELSAQNKNMLYIPEGFAHGFQTLEDNCELIYHHTSFFTPGAESGLKYDDPKIDIQWPLPLTEISERDSSHLLLTEDFNGI